MLYRYFANTISWVVIWGVLDINCEVINSFTSDSAKSKIDKFSKSANWVKDKEHQNSVNRIKN